MDKINGTMNGKFQDLDIEDKWILTNVRQEPIDMHHRDGGLIKPTLSFESSGEDGNKGQYIHVCLVPGAYILVHHNVYDNTFVKMTRIPCSVFKYLIQLQVPSKQSIN